MNNKPKMKAYCASYDGDEWVTYVHGETRGKAKYRFLRVDPSGSGSHSDWNYIRLQRVPLWDDIPFVKSDEYDRMFTSDEQDEEGNPLYRFHISVDCDCELCGSVR